MHKIRTLLGAVVAGACALAVLPGMALAAPTAPYTVLTVDLGDHQTFPVQKSAVYDRDNALMQATIGDEDLFGLEAKNLPTIEYVAWAAQPPVGQSWVVGQTYPAGLFRDDTGRAMLRLTSNHNDCQGSGDLTVRDLERDADTQRITVFAASYRYTCGNVSTPITGEVRWQSSVDYIAAVTNPTTVDFGTREVASPGTARTVTVTAAGSVPSVFGATTVDGPVPGLFTVSNDTCAGQTIAPGGTCTVTVVANVFRDGEQNAKLLIADNTTFGRRVVPLKVVGQRGAAGTFYPLTPTRIMDTRTGLGAPKARLAPAGKVDLQVTGRATVPTTGVGSVVLNVTVTGPTSGGFLTVYPAGEARPTASSINFAANWLGSNNVTVKLGSGGKVSIYNHVGYTHAVVDVVGYYAKDNSIISAKGIGGHYQWLNPYRAFDSRTDGGAVPADYYIDGAIDFGESLSPKIQALVLNITAVNPQRGGYITAWPGFDESDLPTASTVNYAAGKVVPNLAVVRTRQVWNSDDGYYMPAFSVYTSQTTNFLIDVVGVIDNGYYPDGLRFTPLSPKRIADSRINLGMTGALGPGSTKKVTAPAGMVSDSTEVLSMNVTAVTPNSGTYLTAWPADAGMARPGVSNLNPAAGQTVSNAVWGVIGPTDAFNVYNHLGGTHLVADVVGSFYLYPGTATSPTVAQAMAANAERVKVRDTNFTVRHR
ncbi:hypothetical protein V6U81_11335 [Micromonospora sp. CPCC 205711]|uniref:hypothetical protein n=1 Tax=Micromonospora sp. CPCC 205547 TaxID=3122400 RepID=UPI002FF17B91